MCGAAFKIERHYLSAGDGDLAHALIVCAVPRVPARAGREEQRGDRCDKFPYHKQSPH